MPAIKENKQKEIHDELIDHSLMSIPNGVLGDSSPVMTLQSFQEILLEGKNQAGNGSTPSMIIASLAVNTVSGGNQSRGGGGGGGGSGCNRKQKAENKNNGNPQNQHPVTQMPLITSVLTWRGHRYG